MAPPTPIPTTADHTVSSDELAECGWRTEIVVRPDGTQDFIMIPLTEEEFLHPKEDYHLPSNTFHHGIMHDAHDMLVRRYADDPSVGVFSDLIVEWDVPDLDDHCPDVCVALGIKDKPKNRPKFIVANEGTRPALIIEIVSQRYRVADRETKVNHYAYAGVQEYLIIDRRTRRNQTTDEILGYRLAEGRYHAILPDRDGWIECRTVGLKMTMQEGRLLMEDTATGERLRTSRELEAAHKAAEAENAALRERLQALEEALKKAGDPS